MKQYLRLAVFIDAAGIRQRSIARRMNRKEAWLSKIINGSQRAFHDDMIEIADTLSIMVGRHVSIAEISGTIGVSGEQTEAADAPISAASQREGGHL